MPSTPLLSASAFKSRWTTSDQADRALTSILRGVTKAAPLSFFFWGVEILKRVREHSLTTRIPFLPSRLRRSSLRRVEIELTKSRVFYVAFGFATLVLHERQFNRVETFLPQHRNSFSRPRSISHSFSLKIPNSIMAIIPLSLWLPSSQQNFNPSLIVAAPPVYYVCRKPPGSPAQIPKLKRSLMKTFLSCQAWRPPGLKVSISRGISCLPEVRISSFRPGPVA